MGKKSPKPPPAPDYAAAAQAQGQANLDAARLTARISNPNIDTPYGGQRVSFGRKVTDEAAYNKAMEAYNQAVAAQKSYNDRRAQTPSVGPGQFPTTGPLPSQPAAEPTVGGAVDGSTGLKGIGGFEPQYGAVLKVDPLAQGGGSDVFEYDPMTGQQIARPTNQTKVTMPGIGGAGGMLDMRRGFNEPAPDYSQFATTGYSPYLNEKGELVAPTREQFTSMTDLDTPFIEQFLSPEQQKILEAQQRVELGLSGLGETALGTAQDIIGKRFNPNLRDLQTELGGYGNVQGAPDLMGMGRAGADTQAYEFGGAPDLFGYGTAGGGPAGGLYGMASGRVPMERLQRGIDTSQLAAMPVSAGTTGQQAILSRVMPQIQQQRQMLETQLANQGIPRGSEAYNRAITEQQQQENDAVQQAALQGLQLDMSARAQGFGERQAAAQFANQAALGQFGMGAQGLGLRNQAIAQNFGQGQAAQQMQNQAIAQNQDAALRAYQALLAGQGQSFGQQMDVQAARNAALAQNQAIAAQQQQMANAAQLQQYNQALQNAQFGNTALQQSLQQQLALRNQPINEIAALMSGVQVNMPQFQGYQGANVAAAPVFAGTQAAGDFAQRNYSNQVGAYNAQLGLLSGLAGAAGGYFGGR
jgi:hypothetical protein